jgi:hypothetical protein
MKNCKNCKHCKVIIDNSKKISPGGMMMITNYRCTNSNSDSFGNKMNVITHTMTMTKIDSRENNSCDNFDDPISSNIILERPKIESDNPFTHKSCNDCKFRKRDQREQTDQCLKEMPTNILPIPIEDTCDKWHPYWPNIPSKYVKENFDLYNPERQKKKSWWQKIINSLKKTK